MKRYFGRKAFRKNLENIDADTFLEMLYDKLEGKIDPLRDCILYELIRTNPFAKELYEDMKATYPNARLRIRCRTRVIRNRVLIAAAFLLLAFASGYALFYLPHKASSIHQKDHRFYHVRIEDLMDDIQRMHNVKIVLEEGIADERCSGVLDPEIPLNELLDYIAWANGLEYYFDAAGVVHVKKIEPVDRRRQ